MKKFVKYLGIGFLIILFAATMALASNDHIVASADASAFVNTNITADQLVYNQVNHEAGLLISDTKTLDVNNSGYGAYHNGPGTDGKGFFANEMGVKVNDTLKVACYSVDVKSQGMSQAMTTEGNAGAGVSAQGGAVGGASAGGVSGGVQGQYTSYNLAGMSGGGAQLMGTASYVSVNTTAGSK